MKNVLQRGGDTDTNCCIVGGMIGAMIGFENLPVDYREKMLLCDSTKSSGRFKRPECFNPSRCIEIVDKILQIAPQEVKIIK